MKCPAEAGGKGLHEAELQVTPGAAMTCLAACFQQVGSDSGGTKQPQASL